MRTTRIHLATPLASGQELVLPAGPSAHLLRVLRLRTGAILTLFDGRGGEYVAELTAAGKAGARLQVGEHLAIERESPLRLALLQAVVRGERMDFIVQKATELGVQRIVPLTCEFGVVRLEATALRRRAEHWRAVAIAACEQCGRNRVPEITPIREFADACAGSEAGVKLLLVPHALAALAALARGGSAVTLLVGPEGGLSGREQLLAQRNGFQPCGLGPRILRAETAPLAALAVLQALAGDLAG